MRPAPAIAVDLPALAGWRLAYCALAALSCSVALCTLAARLSLPSLLLGACLASGCVVAVGLAWRCTPFSAGRLRWDGATWWFQAPAWNHACAGRVDLMLDLGDRMLLRFVPDPLSDGTRSAWLPVARLPAHEAGALRAAVYCPGLNPDLSLRRRRDPR